MLLDYWDAPQTRGQTTLLADNRSEAAVCPLTVDLRARPLGSGVFVGGADGVPDCRERLQQRERSRQRFSDKEAAPGRTSGSSVSLQNVDSAARHNYDF